MYKVMVGPGDKVAPGDPLIVMIAMKMEYVIKVISANIKLTTVHFRSYRIKGPQIRDIHP